MPLQRVNLHLSEVEGSTQN